MNEELWKRLPAPTGERIGWRARACVRCVQDSGPPGSWARLLGCPVAILCPQCPPALLVVRSAGGACVDTAGRGSAAGGWQLDVGALRREIREGGSSAGVETHPSGPVFLPPGSLSRIHVGAELVAWSLLESSMSGSPQTPGAMDVARRSVRRS